MDTCFIHFVESIMISYYDSSSSFDSLDSWQLAAQVYQLPSELTLIFDFGFSFGLLLFFYFSFLSPEANPLGITTCL